MTNDDQKHTGVDFAHDAMLRQLHEQRMGAFIAFQAAIIRWTGGVQAWRRGPLGVEAVRESFARSSSSEGSDRG